MESWVDSADFKSSVNFVKERIIYLSLILLIAVARMELQLYTYMM